jgi:hypothetical protein
MHTHILACGEMVACRLPKFFNVTPESLVKMYLALDVGVEATHQACDKFLTGSLLSQHLKLKKMRESRDKATPMVR